MARRATAAARKATGKVPPVSVAEVLRNAPIAKVTAQDLKDAREGDRYRRSGRKGISIDEADEILRTR